MVRERVPVPVPEKLGWTEKGLVPEKTLGQREADIPCGTLPRRTPISLDYRSASITGGN